LQKSGEKRRVVPCVVCGHSTRGGDGGASADVEEALAHAAKKAEEQKGDEKPAAPEAPAAVRSERCRSCLTEEERDVVNASAKRLHAGLGAFIAGRDERHVEPEETRTQMAHRLGAAALETTAEVLGLVPGVPVTAMRGAQALHGVVKYGPLALYQNEVVDSLSLLAALSASSGVMPTGQDEFGSPVLAAGDTSTPAAEKPRDCTGRTAQAVKETRKAANEMSELSAGLYYLLVERRGAVGLDPGEAEREHAGCKSPDLATLTEIAEVLPLATPIAYSEHAEEAQRHLKLIKGAWQLAAAEPAGPGGQPPFILAVDRQAKRAAVLVPGTQTPADLVHDLSAIPVHVPLGPGHCTGWVHRGMLRQAVAVVRLVGSLIERLERDGYTVLFTGHSLGGGIAALAGLVMRLGLEGAKSDRIRSFCYATPACGNNAVGKFCEAHAITVVNCDDIVPRLSIETARKLRIELERKREDVRRYISQDVEALQNVQNLTEKKRRNVNPDSALGTAEELQALGIPAPKDAKAGPEPKRPPKLGAPPSEAPFAAGAPTAAGGAAAPSVAPSVAAPFAAAAFVPPTAAAAAKTKAKPSRQRFMFCLGGSLPKDDDIVEPEEIIEDEGEKIDPSDVKLYPPGKVLHLYRHCGARRAFWITRKHPSLHRIEVMYGLMKDHSGDSYREGIEEALAFARGARPVAWKPFSEVPKCSCCEADFHWASVLASEPHRLQARNHCHSCGDVVCDGCSQRKRPLPHLGVMREVRTCDRCFLRGGLVAS